MKNKTKVNKKVQYPTDHPGIGCYTMPKDGGKGHYKALEYKIQGKGKNRQITVLILHGKDSFLPGVAVFGVPFEDLKPCGCGKFRWWKE